jgi:GxxExxY protein
MMNRIAMTDKTQTNRLPMTSGGINELTHRIIGCAMPVHNSLGNGFQEVIYQRALALEMTFQELSFEREKKMPIFYRDKQIGMRRVDFFVDNRVMVEFKAVKIIQDVHKAQAINYLEAYGIADGFLMNFGGRSLEFRRLYNKKLVRTPFSNPVHPKNPVHRVQEGEATHSDG